MSRLSTLPASFLASLLCCSTALAYLPPKGVQFELVEFQSEGRIVQGGLFSPDPLVFAKPTTGIVLVHGVESYWYSGPPMFLGGYLAEHGYAALGYNGIHSGRTFRTSEFETAVTEVGAAVTFLKTEGQARLKQDHRRELARADDENRRERVVVIDRRTKAIIWQYGVTDRKGHAPGYLNYPDGFDIDVFRDWKGVMPVSGASRSLT